MDEEALSVLEELSYAIHWPTVGWIGAMGIALLAVLCVWVVVEVKRQLRRRRTQADKPEDRAVSPR